MRFPNLYATLCLATLPFALGACGGGGGGTSTLPAAGGGNPLAILDLGLPAEAVLIGEFDPLAEEYALRLPFLGDELVLRPIYADPSAESFGSNGLVAGSLGELEAVVAEGDNHFEILASLPATGEQRTVRVLVQREFAADLRQENTVKPDNAQPGDAHGRAIAMDENLLVVGAPTAEQSGGTPLLGDAGTVHVFERDGDSWKQVASLRAPAPGTDDNFGASVAIDGDLIVIGAPGEDGGGALVDPLVDEGRPDCGAAYIFRRIEGAWTFAHYLKPDDADLRRTRGFGASVAVAGDIVAVGAPEEGTRLATGGFLVPAARAGAVYAYVVEGDGFRFDGRLQAPDAEVGAEFGKSLAVSGLRLAIGAPGADELRGKVYLMRRGSPAAGFQLEREVVAPNAGIQDGFGQSVALEGNQLLVGAPGEDSAAERVGGNQFDDSAVDSGAAYLFELKGQLMLFQGYLKGLGSGAGERFGSAVALSNDIICVGTPFDIGAAFGESSGNTIPIRAIGSVVVYTRRGGVLELADVLRAANSHADAQFGASVAIGADDIAVGSPADRSFGAGIDGSSVVVGGPGRGAVLTFR